MNIHPKLIIHQRGFTLIEFMMTLSIAAILMSIATPSFHDFIQQTRLTNATYELHSAMNLARTEAIKRNNKVDLIANDGNWKNGWSISVNNQPIVNHEPLHHDLNIETTFHYKVTPYISYNGSGRTRTEENNNQPQIGTIRLSIGRHARLIAVNFLGRIRVCNPATASAKTCGHTLE